MTAVALAGPRRRRVRESLDAPIVGSRSRPDTGLVAIAWFALIAGAVFYLAVRPGAERFLPDPGIAIDWPAGTVFAVVAGSLPSFLHTLAFCLLGAAVLGPTRRLAVPFGLSWALAEILFEFSQLETVRAWLASHWQSVGVELSLAVTFDVFDIAAIVAGAGIGTALILRAASDPEDTR